MTIDSNDYYCDHSWKSKLKQLGKQVRKILYQCAPGRLRRKKAGYMRFRSDEEQRIRLILTISFFFFFYKFLNID